MISVEPEAVTAIVWECAEKVVLPRFQNLSDGQIWKKDNGSVVTEADIEAEKFLKERLVALLPGSVTVGEEETEADPAILNRLSGDAPAWVIDPVDGTSNYARGKERFAMLVALCHRDEIIGGWLAAPAQGRYLSAIKGEGAWEAGKRLSTSRKSGDLASLSGSLSRRLRKQEAISERFGGIIHHACCGAEYIEIASGALDFAHYRRVKAWDHCAGDLVVREAGGHTGGLGEGAYKPTAPPRQGLLIACSKEAYDGLETVLKPAVAAL